MVMQRRARRRAPFVVTLASVATAVACGGSTAGDLNTGGSASSGATGGSGTGGSGGTSGTSGTSGSGGSGGVAPGCPASFPANGTSCSLPESTLCEYEQGPCCPAWGAQCVNGQWQAYASSCNPPPPDPCPEKPPVAGTACGSQDPCGNSYQYCTYGTCADSTTPHTVAQCNGGTWEVKEQCSAPGCEGLSECECAERSDCKIESDGCLCLCDYSCPGMPPCDCACGGGKYLGCKPIGG